MTVMSAPIRNTLKFCIKITTTIAMFFSAISTVSAAAPSTQSDVEGQGAGALLAKYEEFKPQLSKNQFNRPLYLDSTESPGSLKGDIYAVLSYPFSSVSQSFKGPERWCDMLILHLNTKYCRATNDGGRPQLLVSIGKKNDQPLDEAYQVAFSFAAPGSTADYLDVTLNASDGPMGTSDYRIILEAVPLPDGKSFIHLTYSYGYGVAAKLAMRAYLSTVGSGKVGFTRNGGTEKNDYIGGVRGVVERNTMRYYLAIDSYLSALNVPLGAQLERRLGTWFDATERYHRQLHEVDREDYLKMKRSEYKRQQTAM